MYRGLKVAVVIPAYNEERHLAHTLRSVPGFVDRIIVVDDASQDRTARIAQKWRRRVDVIRHEANRGVGAAIASGYRAALAWGADVAVVMAGDGQMDPADMPRLLEPIADGKADYAKGNRFLHKSVWRVMPFVRLIGNIVLSLLTKVSSGYYSLFDSQCGYTAISARALSMIDLERLFPRYGYPNDILARLRVAGCRAVDVPVRPIYGHSWRSGIRPWTALYPVAWVLLRSFVWRLGATLVRLWAGNQRASENLLTSRST